MASFFRMSEAANRLRHVGSRAKHWMTHHPIAANSFLCLNLWAAGDVLAQYSEHKLLHNIQPEDSSGLEERQAMTEKNEQELDWTRTAKCASYGATITGPIFALWYPFLEKMSKQHNLVARFGLWGAPAVKVLADQIMLDPPLLVMFFSYMNACEGGDRESLKVKLKTEFWSSYAVSWMTWPVVLMATFRYLPIYAHAPLINVCCIAWDGFLSHRNAVVKHEQQALAKKALLEKNDPVVGEPHGETRDFVSDKKEEYEAVGSALKDMSSGEIITTSPTATAEATRW
jgi:hypothetical protein